MNTDATRDTFQRHLRALLRAETLIAQIKLAAILKKTALLLFAGVIAIFGLATLNFAAYRALVPLWGEVWGLVVVAAGDFVIAGVLVLLASRTSDSPELPLAGELRDEAVAALELDARLAFNDVTRFIRQPMQFAGSLLSVVTALLRMRRKK